MERYRIIDIIDIETGEKSKEFEYRIGRICLLNLEYLTTGLPMVVFYPNNAYFRTSIVLNNVISNNKVTVCTMNRKYVFEKIEE